MSATRYDQDGFKAVEHLVEYFDLQVLAAYRSEPHKYTIQSDDFQGELRVTGEYFRELERLGKTDQSVSVRFGYRTLKGGNLAVVAWLPDLYKRSKAHQQKWAGFRLSEPEWTSDYDERFDKWVRRHLEGSFDVDNGPLPDLAHTMRIINGLTTELVGLPLYQSELDETLGYPQAENTHRYQDSHEELYGHLIDSLDKECISRLASNLGKSVKVSDKTTVQALTRLFPTLETPSAFAKAINLVSEQRRLASHGVRPPAKDFPSFSQFTKDLAVCVEALQALLQVIEREFNADGQRAFERHQAKEWLPRIVTPSEGHHLVVQASAMKGKTVERVQYGTREDIKNVHGSEVLIIHFTDGSIMSIDTGSNLANVLPLDSSLRAEDVNVDFVVNWVPKPKRSTD